MASIATLHRTVPSPTFSRYTSIDLFSPKLPLIDNYLLSRSRCNLRDNYTDGLRIDRSIDGHRNGSVSVNSVDTAAGRLRDDDSTTARHQRRLRPQQLLSRDRRGASEAPETLCRKRRNTTTADSPLRRRRVERSRYRGRSHNTIAGSRSVRQLVQRRHERLPREATDGSFSVQWLGSKLHGRWRIGFRIGWILDGIQFTRRKVTAAAAATVAQAEASAIVRSNAEEASSADVAGDSRGWYREDDYFERRT